MNFIWNNIYIYIWLIIESKFTKNFFKCLSLKDVAVINSDYFDRDHFLYRCNELQYHCNWQTVLAKFQLAQYINEYWRDILEIFFEQFWNTVCDSFAFLTGLALLLSAHNILLNCEQILRIVLEQYITNLWKLYFLENNMSSVKTADSLQLLSENPEIPSDLTIKVTTKGRLS